MLSQEDFGAKSLKLDTILINKSCVCAEMPKITLCLAVRIDYDSGLTIDLLAILQKAWIECYFYTFLCKRFDRVALEFLLLLSTFENSTT